MQMYKLDEDECKYKKQAVLEDYAYICCLNREVMSFTSFSFT